MSADLNTILPEIILAIYQSAWTGRTVSLPLTRDPRIPAEMRRKK